MKKILFWIPRGITILYPIIVVTSTITDSVLNGFSLKGAGMMFGLALILSILAAISWKWPKIGGPIWSLLGMMILIGSSNSSIGIDWRGFLFGGIPTLIAGILFIFEGYKKK